MDVAAAAGAARVTAAGAAALAERPVALDTPPRDWPTAPPPGAAELAHLAAPWREWLEDAGHAVVDTGSADLDDDGVATAAWNAFALLCEPLPQYDSGELIHPVEVQPSSDASSPYSNSTASGMYHTDGSMLPEPPPVVALFCLSPAPHGGETVLIDVHAAVAELGRRAPELAEALRREHPCAFDAESPTRRQPILATDPRRGTPVFRYVRWYVEQGYENAEEALPADLAGALGAIDEHANDPRNQIVVPLARGEMLLFDNHRFLHGRLSFSTEGGARRLRRVYGRLR